ncbi:MAG: pseudouridine synthase [Leptolyngbya sp.]|nr:MAG: pseudouridine synthase [Leptolyngbya sp.]
MDERVQKVLSRWGIAARRQVEQLIQQGRVEIDGRVAYLGQKVDPTAVQISVDGAVVNPIASPQRIYLLMNKPRNVVSTCDDPQKRQTVLDLLSPVLRQGQGIHPVGRLDEDSTGALLLTNDGDLTFYLTHPRYHVPKTYQVWVEGYPSLFALKQWQQGVLLEGKRTLPADISVLKSHPDRRTLLEIVLKEGRNRQIRRIAEQLGHPVQTLHRTAIGSIRLQSASQSQLENGDYRPLTSPEICFLRSQIDLTSKKTLSVGEECRA